MRGGRLLFRGFCNFCRIISSITIAARTVNVTEVFFCLEAREAKRTSLIERGLPDARIERSFDPEGLICRVDLPTSGVRDDTD